MSQPHVVLCDDLDPQAVARLEQRGVAGTGYTGLDENGLVAAAAEADALVVRSASKITRRVLESGARLKAVGRAGIGVDNIDTAAATERGVVVMNTPGGNTLSTAELALSLCLALARNLVTADGRTRAGTWNKQGLMGTEITGKRLGVVGLGRVGRLLAERALGIGMQVSAYDPHLEASGLRASGLEDIQLVALDKLLVDADFISLHVPLVDATRGLIGAEQLATMKSTAYLVNTSRGGVVDEVALAHALEQGQLAGAALDVLEQEPPAADHPLIGHPKVLLTPHLGASSKEAQARVALMVAEQLADFLLDGVIKHAVNLPPLPNRPASETAGALDLTERMGRFAAQALGAPVGKVELTANGPLVELGSELLALSTQVGLLKPSMDTAVNFVNAPLLAKERGWRVLTAEESDSVYQGGHLDLRVESKDGNDSITLRGALFGDSPRIVRVRGVHVDLEPAGPHLLTAHVDQPGVLGKIGTVLGAHGINLRRVDLGSSAQHPEGLASAYLALDREPDAECLKALREIEPVRQVQSIRL
jgi:D-3-phosphoglycerate dehydrogenase